MKEYFFESNDNKTIKININENILFITEIDKVNDEIKGSYKAIDVNKISHITLEKTRNKNSNNLVFIFSIIIEIISFILFIFNLKNFLALLFGIIIIICIPLIVCFIPKKDKKDIFTIHSYNNIELYKSNINMKSEVFTEITEIILKK